MRQLTATELLDAWERGLAESPPARALTLLSACTGAGRDQLARLSVGERDRLLLSLREYTFGPRLDALAECPSCGERLELSFEVADVTVGREGPAEDTLPVSVGGYEAVFRRLNSLDLLAVAPAPDARAARRALFTRCLLSARRGDEEITADLLPEEVVERLAAAMAEADPQADVELALECPGCGCGWSEPLDVCAYLWGEIDAWAMRTFCEVHALARAYGWGEREILSMSPWRRQLYLTMVT
jgi:hypothetical protein